MALTHKMFGIRSCNEVITGLRARPCLEYDIGRCLAPCVMKICTEERYSVAVADTRLFLEGRNEELADQLRARMTDAAADERYEEAAQLRDAIRTIEAVRERQQKMATAGLNDRDVIGVKLGGEGAIVQVFVFRGGRVIERFDLQTSASAVPGETSSAGVALGSGTASGAMLPATDAELLEVALQQIYADSVPPPEVHVPIEPTDKDVLEVWLSSRADRRVRIVVPQRGDKKDMVELAQRNAALTYRSRFDRAATAHGDALDVLKRVLTLPALPRRIECFDISTIQGAETVASMVVCEDGRMKRSDYRKFRVRPAETAPKPVKGPGFLETFGDNSAAIGAVETLVGTVPARPGTVPTGQGTVPTRGGATREPGRFLDDFAAMRQVVGRRYKRVLEEGGPFPDLIVIDGGKGQLNAAYEALEEVGLANLVAVGLAKKEELVFVRHSEQPIALDPHGAALRLLQRIRDEAHRFAVTFHRQSRTSRDLRSALDVIPGIGARRRKALLTRFGSVNGVRRATREELTTVVGARAASAIIDHFAQAV
jgi:excinuclease ABC subunit C